MLAIVSIGPAGTRRLAAKLTGMRPVLGIWEQQLERALLRKGLGELRAGVSTCTDCGRVPLVGERVHVFDHERIVCELCRPGHGGEPLRAERVRGGERGQTVRTVAPAARRRRPGAPGGGPRGARRASRSRLRRAVDPVELQVVISRPREEVFAYLADISNHPEFLDHFLVDWHLTREVPWGEGAGARYRMRAPLHRFPWADVTFIEVEPPRRIVEAGRSGKFNRIRTRHIWELEDAGGGTTRVRLTVATEPKLPSDRFLELFAGRRWAKRRYGRGLRRLRSILEEGRGRGSRVTISGGARKPASQYRYQPR
jgi:uncharacterized protein YndB with AHSA1/START domain